MSIYRRILVAVDGSTSATAALSQALALAIDQDATLRIAHVIDTVTLNAETLEGGRVPRDGVSPQPGRAEMRGTQRATADSRVGTVSLSICRPSSCM